MCSFVAYRHSPELLAAVRLKPTAFLRHRKLPFVQRVSTLLSGLTASVQNELKAFAAHRDKRAELQPEVSAQAFSKARNGFSHQVFALLNQYLLALVEQPLPVPRWQGFRLVAADASKLQLFLKEATGRQVREAIACLRYLPGPELSLSFERYAPSVGERQRLFEQLVHLQANDLLLLDRGYPAAWLMAARQQRQRHFCLRVDNTGFAAVKAFRRSGQREAVVALPPPSLQDAQDYGVPRKPVSVRLIRVVTPNGQCPVVRTSLLDPQTFPAATFADLYHARWRIEEAFKRLKHRLKLEHLSGLSWLAAQQDFGAKRVCDNLNALAVYAAQPVDTTAPMALAPAYQPTRTYGFAALKRCLPRWLMGCLPDLSAVLALFGQLLRNVIRFVPGHSKPRPKRPKPHLHHAYKATA